MNIKKINSSTSLNVYNVVEGETIEQKLDRIVNNKEPIKDGAPLIYTERKEGIRPSTNIRTDRFEIAIEATDIIAKSYKARRENKGLPKDEVKNEVQPTEGKGETPTT